MKKLVLIAIAVVAGLCANAQTTDVMRPVKIQRNTPVIDEGVPSGWKQVPVTTPPKPKKVNDSKHIASNPVTSVAIGKCGNAFGLIGGIYQALWADPRINTVAFIHRSDPNTNPLDISTGFLRYDYSTDGGNTWNPSHLNVGPIFMPNGDPQGQPFSVARYPQGGIYNPPSNTDPTNAFVTYFAPLRDNTNPDPSLSPPGDWGGVGYGVAHLGDTNLLNHGVINGLVEYGINSLGDTVSTQHKDSSNEGGNNAWYIIPDGFTITQQGVAYSISLNLNTTTSTTIYENNLIINRGVFNSSTHDYDYTTILLDAPVDLNNQGQSMVTFSNIAFDTTGKIGYVVLLGHIGGFASDSNYTPIVYKSTDSGMTWNGPTKVNVDSVNILLGDIAPDQTYNTINNVDLIVDAYSNLHMIVPILSNLTPGGLVTTGYWGEFDVFTNDGGTSWFAHLLAEPQSYEGVFGNGTSTTNPGVNEFTRGQATSTWDGTKLFFTWFDTDSVTYYSSDAGGNLNPDMHSVGYNVINQTWTPDTNFTLPVNIGGYITFGLVSQYAFTPSGYYNIPVVYNELQGNVNTGIATQLYYIQNADFTDADFSIPTQMDTNVVPLQASSGIKKISSANDFYLSTYPNPSSNMVNVSYVLNSAAPVTMEILNILGERVSTIVPTQNLGTGVHNTTLNISNLSNGVYMLRTTIGEKVVISKLTKI